MRKVRVMPRIRVRARGMIGGKRSLRDPTRTRIALSHSNEARPPRRECRDGLRCRGCRVSGG